MISPELLQEIKPIQDWLGGTKSILTSRGGVPQVPINTLPDLNSKIWGLHNGLTVLGARSSMGKSAFAIQIARDVSDSNIPCLFLSLEMDVPSIIERMFCQQMSVDNFDMLCGKINNDEEIQKKWETFEKWVHRVPLMITDGLGKSFQEVTTMVELLDPKPKVVIIDYIQGIKQSEKERAELNEYIRSFRTLMLKNKMVGILASQMNRQIVNNSDKRPALENLKGTGVLEEHADMVLMLYWEYFYTRDEQKKNDYEVIIGKNRNGRTGKHDMYFVPEYYLFRERS